MSYWEYDSSPNNSPFLAAYTYGQEISFSLTFVNDTDATIHGAYLFVDEMFRGLLSVKLSTGEVYLPIMGPNDPAAFVGNLAIGSTQFDFTMLNDQYPLLAYFVIPIYVASGQFVQAPVMLWTMDYDGGLWRQCFARHQFWREEFDVPLPDCESEIEPGGNFYSEMTPALWINDVNPPMWTE
jgi:hypothetical protein